MQRFPNLVYNLELQQAPAESRREATIIYLEFTVALRLKSLGFRAQDVVRDRHYIYRKRPRYFSAFLGSLRGRFSLVNVEVVAQVLRSEVASAESVFELWDPLCCLLSKPCKYKRYVTV